MKFPFIIFTILPLLSSCALFSPNEPDETYRYLTGQGLENPKTVDIKNALMRDLSMAGGNYSLKAYPYTRTLVEAMSREKADLLGLPPKHIERYAKQMEKDFIDDKVCFYFEYEVLRFEKASRLENFKLALLDKEDQSYPLQFIEEDLGKQPGLSKVLRSGDRLPKWFGSGIACTKANPSLNKGFGLKVEPTFVQFPFDKMASMYWEFPEIKIVDGKEVKIHKKKKNYKSYRGW